MDSVVIDRNGSDTSFFFFFFNKKGPPGTYVPSGVYKRQCGYGEQNLQGNDKMAAEGNPKNNPTAP